MGPRTALAACLAAVLGVAVLAVPRTRSALTSFGQPSQVAAAFSAGSPSPSPSPLATAQIMVQPAPPGPTLAAPADPASIKAPGNPSFFSWAFLDRRTGSVVGSANSATGTNTTESMIKAWIAADYLRMHDPSDTDRTNLRLMIIDSNDDIAEDYYRMDGTNAVVKRLISTCHLSHTTMVDGYWSRTMMTPQDAVQYGRCIGDGTAAGPKWTGWLLDVMRQVRGGVWTGPGREPVTKQGGRWGIIDGLPPEIAAQTSIKNGFTGWNDGWHVNCLAIHQDWVLNVMVRIGSEQQAANVCKAVAQQLVVTPQV